MSIPAALPPTPRGSSLEALVAAVSEIYERVAREQRAFLEGAASRGATLACPPGCGSCCEPFVPDILPAEAAFIAAWLLENEAGLAARAAAWTDEARPASPPCPFFRRESPSAHCSIYPARPLVCRLFGAAGTRDREGRASFRPCARMELAGYPPVGSERKTMTGTELDLVFGSAPPLMADHASALVALCPSEASGRSPIFEALPAALARVSLHLSLAEAALGRA
jgi:Fe-S-cluster containining protein